MLDVIKIVMLALLFGVVLAVGGAVVFMLWSPKWRAHFTPTGPSRREALDHFRQLVAQQRALRQRTPAQKPQ